MPPAKKRPRRQRADVVRERPGLGPAGAGIEAPDAGVADPPSGAVHPVEAAVLDVPDRPLAQMIGAFEHALDPVGHAAATSPSPRPPAFCADGLTATATLDPNPATDQ